MIDVVDDFSVVCDCELVKTVASSLCWPLLAPWAFITGTLGALQTLRPCFPLLASWWLVSGVTP